MTFFFLNPIKFSTLHFINFFFICSRKATTGARWRSYSALRDENTVGELTNKSLNPNILSVFH